MGIHPQLVNEYSSEIDLFCSLIPECGYVGEVGLDGSSSYIKSLSLQKVILNRILQASAINGGGIISLHSRGAANHVLDCLEANNDAGINILHWFSGSIEELRRAIQMDC